ncbi:hypothetical protein AB0D10_31985 [Kitasatospora sp. NPDC048545]|uniref:hypothetical protein n=1 Tax=Kitasatospora sp. NPDC048545 TaxID=3157208 RepID=UPI0033DF5B21
MSGEGAAPGLVAAEAAAAVGGGDAVAGEEELPGAVRADAFDPAGRVMFGSAWKSLLGWRVLTAAMAAVAGGLWPAAG